MKYFILSLVLLGCSSNSPKLPIEKPLEMFQLVDANGTYGLKRETKTNGNKIITRTSVLDKDGKELESTIAVSRVGKLGSSDQVAMLPEASQFQVWFNKKKYQSQLKIKASTKEIVGQAKNPDEPLQKFSESLKKARFYCFFSQLPECILKQNILAAARNKSVMIHVIWDNYPFNSEQYDKMPQGISTMTKFSFFEKRSDSIIFELDIGNQVILYHFNRQLRFVKMFWVTQGISITK